MGLLRFQFTCNQRSKQRVRTTDYTVHSESSLNSLEQVQDGYNQVGESPQSWWKYKACDRGHFWQGCHLLLFLSALVPALQSLHSGAQGILRGGGGRRDHFRVV